jgi:mono/diheme cytochrome c family protein
VRAALLLLVLAAARPAAHDPITTKVTFAREIRAILSARCASCHSPGGPAPMPLTTYEEVRPWARAIKEQVLTRRMPVWHAARGYGAFKNDPTLTPIEIAMIVSWVDGGLPFSASSRGAGSPTPPRAASAPSRPVASAFRRTIGTPAVTVPAGAIEASARVGTRWVSGWSFEPGDPLITSATFSLSDGTVVGNWVAGDDAVALPLNSAIRISSPLRVSVQRRKPTDYDQPYKARASLLRLVTRTKRPLRRAWTEQVRCGTPRTGRAADLIAIRPMLADEGAARIWLERAGAPKTIVGWFRAFDSRFPRTYWLARPADLSVDARVQGDAPCELQLTLVSHR